ncbi:phosphoinositide 3-kinase regulatory subunit 4, partial [Etheostoma cragini]|uniref:phosphoinositide 3-kinase regulatory subunit 4 n=1 Tax=Etheostoma cragini TaxID=417921 RepID=UPI00155EEBD2
MGNQLAGIAPSQILSVDSYFSDIHDHEYDKSLGSTRFFKVARAKHREGLVVVKVFAIQDPSLPLTSYKQELEELKIRLHSCQNCLPFQKASLTEKAAILFRQYVRDNLYDRISTRPFLNNVEKRWLAFQILNAVDQAHRAGVRHGDIKTENVMVTSWNWVLLTDFASFKPTYLPEDNPADFNYFFDTSRRRTCYIAPERFVDGSMFTTESDQNTPLVDLTSNNQRGRGELRQAMDIFSAGCVIAELFTEGVPLFDLSQLLAYRKGHFQTEHVLLKIEDRGVRELVAQMVQREPEKRLTAEEYLKQQRGKAFPDIFYTFLQPYMAQFAKETFQSADERVLVIRKDLDNILHNLRGGETGPGVLHYLPTMWEKMFLLLLHSVEAVVASQCWQGATFSEAVVSPAVEGSGILRVPGVSSLLECVAACCDLPGYDLAWLFQGRCYVLSCQQRDSCRPQQRPGADSFLAFLRRASPQTLVLQSLVRGEPYAGRWRPFLQPSEAPGDLEALKDLALFDGALQDFSDPGTLDLEYPEGSQKERDDPASEAETTTVQPSLKGRDGSNQSEAEDSPETGGTETSGAQNKASSGGNVSQGDKGETGRPTDPAAAGEHTTEPQGGADATSLTLSPLQKPTAVSAQQEPRRTSLPTPATPPPARPLVASPGNPVEQPARPLVASPGNPAGQPARPLKAPRRCQSFLSLRKVIMWDSSTSLAFCRPKKTQSRVMPFSISDCLTMFSESLSSVTTFCCTISCSACSSGSMNGTVTTPWTSSGTMACWDMRFQLPISNHSHPARARIRRLLMHPLYQSSVIAAVQGNNEVSMWDMETGDRKFTLWASSAPPLSEMQPSPHSVHGIYCSPADGNPLLLTAGSDMRIRFWDLAYPERSYIVAGGANDSLHCPSVLYSRKIIEGTEVVQVGAHTLHTNS